MFSFNAGVIMLKLYKETCVHFKKEEQLKPGKTRIQQVNSCRRLRWAGLYLCEGGR